MSTRSSAWATGPLPCAPPGSWAWSEAGPAHSLTSPPTRGLARGGRSRVVWGLDRCVIGVFSAENPDNATVERAGAGAGSGAGSGGRLWVGVWGGIWVGIWVWVGVWGGIWGGVGVWEVSGVLLPSVGFSV